MDLFSSSRPRWKSTAALRFDGEAFNIGGRWRYIGPTRNAGNVGVTGASLPPTESVSYFDMDAGIRISDRFELRGGITNLTDRKPPISTVSAIGAFNYELNTYDIVGRRLFVSIGARM